MTIFLWANRLLPSGIDGRADAEVNAMFAGWAAIFLYALARRPARAWVELLVVQALLLIALPLYNLVALPTGLLATMEAGDWVLAGADLTLLALGAGFGFAAWRVHRFRPKARRPARNKPTVSSNLAPAE